IGGAGNSQNGWNIDHDNGQEGLKEIAVKGKIREKGLVEEIDDDLKRPYKEVLKSPFTRRIIEFSAPSHRMPINLWIYDDFTNSDDHIFPFVGSANQGEWEMPGVPEVMQISAFISNSKCLELARRFTDQQGQRYDSHRFKNRRQEVNQFIPESLVKKPKEILATELQLHLPPPPPLIETPRRENLDRYCDITGKRGTTPTIRGDSQKCKLQRRREEYWMNVPITFPPIPPEDVSDEPLIIEAKVEGYLVRRVFVDQVVQASSPYNIILRRTGMRELCSMSSTTHAMMKFPTLRGIAKLVPQRGAIFQYRQLEDKQVVSEEQPKEEAERSEENAT
ncbi:hypothetical protein Tco_1183541, partial [Tanacetum coccineum]